MSKLTMEIFELLGKGTTEAALFKRFARCSESELRALKTDLSLFSEHKLTSADKDAMNALASVSEIATAAQQSAAEAGSKGHSRRRKWIRLLVAVGILAVIALSYYLLK